MDAVPENTKKATKSVFEITKWSGYSPRFQRIIVKYISSSNFKFRFDNEVN